MKTLTLFAILLLATLQSNGQHKPGSVIIPKDGIKSLTTGSISGDSTKLFYVSSRYPEWGIIDRYAPIYFRFFDNNNKMTAELKVGSDTLIIYDSVFHLSQNIPIRFIKINGKVYPLKP